MILAILRAQLQSLRGAGKGRDAGSWLAAIPVLFFYAIFTFMAVGIYALYAFVLDPAALRLGLAIGLLAIFLYWQLAPVLTVSGGASLDLQKLIVYPIDLDKLFIVEVILRMLTVGEMFLILIGIGLGMLKNPAVGGWSAAPRIALALTIFAIFNMLIGAGVRSSIERFFQRRRAKEIGMLLFILAMAAPGAIASSHFRLDRAIAFVPVQAALPWGAAADAILSPTPWRTALSGIGLIVWTALAYLFGRRQFYRALRADAFAGRGPVAPSKQESAWSEVFFRLPGRLWHDPVAALVEKDLRSLSRSSGFRMTFIMGFTFGIIFFVPQAMGRAHGSFLREHLLAWVSLYSMTLMGAYSFWNAFGYDRSAVQFYFSAPVTFRRVLAAKNITAAFAQTLELVLITIVFSALPIGFRWMGVVEAFSVTGVACLYLFAMGNTTSVRFPLPLDPDKASRGSGSRSKSAFTMLILPVAFLPIGLAYWGRHVFESEAVFYLLLAIAAGIGGAFYWVAMDSAVSVTLTQREQMISALSRGSGPLSSN